MLEGGEVDVDASMPGSMPWRLVGPFRGGGVVAFDGHPTERGPFYFGAVAGRVWQSHEHRQVRGEPVRGG